jgi:glycerate-2-kinase
MEHLPAEIDLESLKQTNQILLACGASIEEINIIRKQISLIKGGKLIKKILPVTVISFIISDVIGDSPSTIASGLTIPDSSNFSDAIQMVNKYSLNGQLPENVYNYLLNGEKEERSTSTKNRKFSFEHVHNFIIGTNADALNSAENEAKKLGYSVIKFPQAIKGEARETAKSLIEFLFQLLKNGNLNFPICLLAGGETTVSVTGDGKGGRNQELTLALLPLLEKSDYKFLFGSIGTDGTDGFTDAAGAWIGNNTLISMREQRLNPLTFLNNNDSFHFFKKTGGLIKTGPTYTNVMDIFIGLIDL